MRDVRRISKKYYLRQIMACMLIYFMLLGMPVQIALGTSNPQQVAGDPIKEILGVGTNKTEVFMGDSGQAVINWDSLDRLLSTDELNFLRESGLGFAVLNRVIGEGGATQFNGKLNGNQGDIFIINTRGIVFGPDSYISARNFVASGIDILNEDFMDGDGVFQFQKNDINPFGNVIGDVETQNSGTTSIWAENIALIGKNVYNKGMIGGGGSSEYVILAAGESVLITETGSDISVEVAMTNPADPSLNVVDNGGSLGTGSGGIGWDTDNVILAAGDIYSTAIEGIENLRAEAKGNIVMEGSVTTNVIADSDAESTVILDADGDITINDQIWVKTNAQTGDPADDAISTIVLDAGGDIYVNHPYVRAQADVSSGSGSAIATVDVDAVGDVIMDNGRLSAGAHGGDQTSDLNKATIEVDATNVILRNDSEIDAGANQGLVNTADVIIKATGDVKLEDSDITAEAVDTDGSNTATVDITAGGVVNVRSGNENREAKITSVASDTDEGSTANNSAKISVTAGSVKVQSDYGDNAQIKSTAEDGATNTADVTITTNGTGEGDNPSGDVKIISNSWSGQRGYAGISALAEDSSRNDAKVTIDATGDVEVIARNGGGAEIEAEAINWLYDSDTTGRENIALVDIDADGRVKVKADDGWSSGYPYYDFYPSEAEIEAKAHNFLQYEPEESEGSFTEDVPPPINVTLDNLKNTATIEIDASKVEVLGYDGGVAKISTEASNRWDEDEPDYSLTIIANNWINKATVDITTIAVEDDEQNNGDVKVIGGLECEEDGIATITANAWNGLLEGVEPDPGADIPENLVNTATVTIDADREVKVMGEYGDAAITASTSYGNDNTATTTITADGDLKVEAYNGTATVEAVAKYGVDNTTGVVIDVVGGDVMVKDVAGGYTAKIDARSQYALNSNTSDVQISATAVEVIEEVDQDVFESYVKGGNVRVISRDGGYAKISAFAGDAVYNDFADIDETTNTANVTIRTTGIEVTRL
ncbi:MAG: hypothetical protein ACYSSN_11130, partial [Planctomycetota bacterium]